MTNPDHITKTFAYKIRPNRVFTEACLRTMDQARFIYNCALEQRISYHRQTGKTLTLFEQSRQLTEARNELPWAQNCLRSIQQDALERLDFAFQSFFRRLKQKGVKPGFPRFKSKSHTVSQRFEKGRKCPISGDRLTVPGIGSCRVRLSRPIEGKVKQIRITRRASGWYALLICDLPRPVPLPPTGRSVGVDVGLSTFATLSNGEKIPNPRLFKTVAGKVRKAQHAMSRKKKGSKNRAKARRLFALRHERVTNARSDFHHKISCDLVRRFDVIAVESLNVEAMMKSHSMAAAIGDVAWSSFFRITQAKAENAGRVFEKKPARFTSQTCSRCEHRQVMPLAVRVFDCESCGHVIDRDHNAAINIRRGAPIKPVENDRVRGNRNKSKAGHHALAEI